MKKSIIFIFISLYSILISCDKSTSQLYDMMREVKSQNDQLLQQVKSLQLKSDLLIAEIKLSAAKQEELLARVSDLQTQLSNILSQIDSLNKQLNNQGADIELIKSKLSELQTQYQGIVEQLQELQKLSLILAEIEKMKTQLSQLDEKYLVVSAGLIQNKQQLDALKSQVTAIQNQIASDLSKINLLVAQIQEQGTNIKIILDQVTDLKTSLEKLTENLKSIVQTLTQSDITTGLIAYYPFNGNAKDESGNGNDGTIFGSVSLTTNRSGIANSAYNFAGNSNSYINIGSPSNLMLQDEISISTWFTMDGGTISPRLLQFGCAGQEFIVASIGTNNTSREMDIGINGLIIRVPNVSSNNWNNIIYTAKRSSGTASVYLNGNLIKKLQVTPITSKINYATNFNIGRMACPANDAWGGKIDDIRIYNRVLTEDQIQFLYKSN